MVVDYGYLWSTLQESLFVKEAWPKLMSTPFCWQQYRLLQAYHGCFIELTSPPAENV